MSGVTTARTKNVGAEAGTGLTKEELDRMTDKGAKPKAKAKVAERKSNIWDERAKKMNKIMGNY